MKFNTAAMHNDNQHVDEENYDRANENWEEGLARYEERLKEIDGVLPASVKKFMKACHLHDADFDPFCCVGNTHPSTLQLVIRQQNWGDWKFICVLRYTMAAPWYAAQVLGDHYRPTVDIKVNEGPGFYNPKFDPDDPKPPHIPHWLYDEWDHLGTVDGVLGKKEIFSHSFLLSNGVEFNIVFTDFEFLFVPIGEGFVESGK